MSRFTKRNYKQIYIDNLPSNLQQIISTMMRGCR
jgi:hypothetical protein